MIRGALKLLIATLIPALAAILLGTTASASATVGAETRVRASVELAVVLVGPPEHETAGKRLGNSAAKPEIVVATVVAAESESGLASAARSCSVNSFTGATLVTMADGSKKPIRHVKVGDKVLATDPETGQTAARPVTSLIVHSGKHTMVDIDFVDGTSITATDRHPFWDATKGQFTYAMDLKAGDQVRELDGTLLTVAGTRVYDEVVTAYNLTVDGIHTYYAGTTPVLVHNSCGGSLFRFGAEPESAASLGDQAAAAEANGFPHGVSVFSRSSRADAVSASRSSVEDVFNVIKTGRNPYHYTVELPNPVTQDVADIFNSLFGRLG